MRGVKKASTDQPSFNPLREEGVERRLVELDKKINTLARPDADLVVRTPQIRNRRRSRLSLRLRIAERIGAGVGHPRRARFVSLGEASRVSSRLGATMNAWEHAQASSNGLSHRHDVAFSVVSEREEGTQIHPALRRCVAQGPSGDGYRPRDARERLPGHATPGLSRPGMAAGDRAVETRHAHRFDFRFCDARNANVDGRFRWHDPPLGFDPAASRSPLV